MNELERAAQDIVNNPVAPPSSIVDVEARARRIEHRHKTVRVLAVAATVMVVLLGILGVSAIRHQREGQDVRTGSSADVDGPLIDVYVAWSSNAGADAVSDLVRARLAAYGAADVSLSTTTSHSLAVSARGISYDDAKLLIETRGLLQTAVFSRALTVEECQLRTVESTSPATVATMPGPGASADGSPPTTPYVAGTNLGRGAVSSVGWPTPKRLDTCFTTRSPLTDLGSRVVAGLANPAADPLLKAAVESEGTLSAVHVTRSATSNGAPRSMFEDCAESVPIQCVGLLLDGQLMREPDNRSFAPPGEKPALEDTADGFLIRGFTANEAKIFAAIINAGAHQVDLEVSPQTSGVPVTSAPLTVTTPPTPNGTDDPADLVDIVVAAHDIKRGTTGAFAASNGLVEHARIPREFYPRTAIRSTDEIAGKVALFDIAAGSAIVTGMFVDPNPDAPPVTSTGPVYTTIPTSTTTADVPPPDPSIELPPPTTGP